MHALDPVDRLLLFGLVYASALGILFLINAREFKLSPDKGRRYQALPLRYKLGCWFVVLPLFAGTVFQPALFLGAIAAFTILEAACVRWYRANGLLP
jgi:hypothetical protein